MSKIRNGYDIDVVDVMSSLIRLVTYKLNTVVLYK